MDENNWWTDKQTDKQTTNRQLFIPKRLLACVQEAATRSSLHASNRGGRGYNMAWHHPTAEEQIYHNLRQCQDQCQQLPIQTHQYTKRDSLRHNLHYMNTLESRMTIMTYKQLLYAGWFHVLQSKIVYLLQFTTTASETLEYSCLCDGHMGFEQWCTVLLGTCKQRYSTLSDAVVMLCIVASPHISGPCSYRPSPIQTKGWSRNDATFN